MDLGERLQAMLKEHQWEPYNPELDKPQCTTCEDLGQIKIAGLAIDDPRFGKMFPCPDCERGQQLIQRIFSNRIKNSKIPPEYAKLTFASWEKLSPEFKRKKAKAYAFARLFVKNKDHMVSLAAAYEMCGATLEMDDVKRNSLIFQGPPGVGKTGLMSAIANRLMAHKEPVLYVRTQDFVEAIKSAWERDRDKKEGVTSDAIVDTVKTAPILMLDEFNMNIESEWRKEQIEGVIRFRHANNLPTVITCNADPDELEAQWGLRTTSVLFSMAHWIEMGGEVLRNMRQASEVF